MIEIARFPDAFTAQFAASRLRASDIESTLLSDDAGSSYPNLQMVHGVRVMVAEADAVAAREILADVEAVSEELGGTESTD